MSKRDADTRTQSIARRIVADTKDEARVVSLDLEGILHKVQSEAISLSVSVSELISLIKRQDPEYAAALDAMENPSEESNESTNESGVSDADPEQRSDSAESVESDELESEDEKD